jgi:hypothetical protein
MRKLTQVMQSKLNTLKLFIPWYEKEYGSEVYMADNDVTYAWTLHNIYQNASGVKIVVSGHPGTRGKRTDTIDPRDIGQIYSAVRRGEGDSFKIFVK